MCAAASRCWGFSSARASEKEDMGRWVFGVTCLDEDDEGVWLQHLRWASKSRWVGAGFGVD